MTKGVPLAAKQRTVPLVVIQGAVSLARIQKYSLISCDKNDIPLARIQRQIPLSAIKRTAPLL